MTKIKYIFSLLLFCAIGITLLQSNKKVHCVYNNSQNIKVFEYLHENEGYEYRYVVLKNGAPLTKLFYGDTSLIYFVDYGLDNEINNTIFYKNNDLGNYLHLVFRSNSYYFLCTSEKPISFYSRFEKNDKSEVFPVKISESNQINVYQFKSNEVDSVIYFTISYEGDMKFPNKINPVVLLNLKTTSLYAEIIGGLVCYEYNRQTFLRKGGDIEKSNIELIKQETIKDVKKIIKSYALYIHDIIAQ